MDLHNDFTMLVVNALPAEVRLLLVEVGPKIMVAGGFVRDTITGARPKDIDIFGTTSSVVHAAADVFEDADEREQYIRHETENAISFVPEGEGPMVQFIIRDIRNSHEETLNAFDFSICQAGVYFDDDRGWVGIATAGFLADLPTFSMHYTAPPHNNTIGSLLRMIRFVGRGWKIDDDSVAGIVGRVTKELEIFQPLLSNADEHDHVARATKAIALARRYPDWAPMTNPPAPATNEEVTF